MNHKYERYLHEEPSKKIPKKVLKKIEKKTDEPDLIQKNISKGRNALDRLKNLSDIIIYTEILGKPKGLDY